jgi:Na+/phosphate symporter
LIFKNFIFILIIPLFLTFIATSPSATIGIIFGLPIMDAISGFWFVF